MSTPDKRERPAGNRAHSTNTKSPSVATLSDARLEGEVHSARHGKLAGRVALPPVIVDAEKCSGWCHTLTVQSLNYWGRTRGNCPCTEAWPVLI